MSSCRLMKLEDKTESHIRKLTVLWKGCITSLSIYVLTVNEAVHRSMKPQRIFSRGLKNQFEGRKSHLSQRRFHLSPCCFGSFQQKALNGMDFPSDELYVYQECLTFQKREHFFLFLRSCLWILPTELNQKVHHDF